MAAIIIDAKDARKIPRAMRLATVSAINKAMGKARVAASKEVRQVYNIKAGDIKKALNITRANSKKMYSNHIISGKRLLLSYFSPRQTKKGVTVRIKKSSGRKVVQGAFEATMKTGHKGVFKRKGKSRLPIRELTTLDLPTMYDLRAERVFDKTISSEFNKIFDHEFNYRLSKIA